MPPRAACAAALAAAVPAVAAAAAAAAPLLLLLLVACAPHPAAAAAAAAPPAGTPPCVCVPEEKGGWSYCIWVASYFRDCVYTPAEKLAFALGLLTVGVWMVAQFPQLVESYRLKRVEGVSPGLLLQWLLGDITNLLGCVLAGQLKTQLYTALYFCASDVVLLSQYAYYRLFYAGPLPAPPPLRRRRCSGGDPAAKVPCGGDCGGEEEGGIVDEEEIDLGGAERQPLLPPVPLLNGTSASAAAAAPDPAALEGSAAPPAAVVAGCGPPASPFSAPPPPPRRPRLPSPAPAAKRWAAVAGILALVSGVAALMVWYWSRGSPEDGSDGGGDGGGPAVCDAPKDLTPAQELVGTLSAWGSAGMYFFSRVPQLAQNHRRKSVHGLSILMFGLAVSANLTYGFSILLRFPAVDGSAFWKNTFPYLVGSLGTLAFDAAIMVQARVYGTGLPAAEE